MIADRSSEYWADIVRTNLLIATHLEEKIDTEEIVDEALLTAPRRKGAQHALTCEIAALVSPEFPPDSLATILQYEKDIVKLRSLVKV